MPIQYRLHVNQEGRRPNLLVKILLWILAAGILVLGFFFVAIALVAGALLAAGIAIRWWWFVRKLKQQVTAQQKEQTARQADQGAVEGEFRVIDQTPADPARRDRS